jgi:hypothetical protein
VLNAPLPVGRQALAVGKPMRSTNGGTTALHVRDD